LFRRRKRAVSSSSEDSELNNIEKLDVKKKAKTVLNKVKSLTKFSDLPSSNETSSNGKLEIQKLSVLATSEGLMME
jgi:hypothetical protein